MRGAAYRVGVIHPDIAPLSFLLGTWRGQGRGDYPTIEGFDYLEEVVFSPMPKPVLAYQQKTRRAGTDEPLHAESGYVRLVDGAPELVICQPTGLVEAHAGTLEGTSISWRCDAVGATPSARSHRVGTVTREVAVDGDELRYTMSMAAVGQPLQQHLTAVLRRAEA